VVLLHLKFCGVLDNFNSLRVDLKCSSGSTTSFLVIEVLFVLCQAQRRLGFGVLEFFNFFEIFNHLGPHLHWIHVYSYWVQVLGACKRIVVIFFILFIVKSLLDNLRLFVLEITLGHEVF